jgi:hypothetical protein
MAWWIYFGCMWVNILMTLKNILTGDMQSATIFGALILVNMLGMEVEELKSKSK